MESNLNIGGANNAAAEAEQKRKDAIQLAEQQREDANKSIDLKAADNKALDERKAHERRLDDNRTQDQRRMDQRAADNRAADDRKAQDKKAADMAAAGAANAVAVKAEEPKAAPVKAAAVEHQAGKGSDSQAPSLSPKIEPEKFEFKRDAGIVAKQQDGIEADFVRRQTARGTAIAAEKDPYKRKTMKMEGQYELHLHKSQQAGLMGNKAEHSEHSKKATQLRSELSGRTGSIAGDNKAQSEREHKALMDRTQTRNAEAVKSNTEAGMTAPSERTVNRAAAYEQRFAEAKEARQEQAMQRGKTQEKTL